MWVGDSGSAEVHAWVEGRAWAVGHERVHDHVPEGACVLGEGRASVEVLRVSAEDQTLVEGRAFVC